MEEEKPHLSLYGYHVYWKHKKGTPSFYGAHYTPQALFAHLKTLTGTLEKVVAIYHQEIHP